MQKTFFRWFIYITGLIILSLGVTLNTKTLLGVAPIPSVPYSISTILNGNFGNITMVYYTFFVIIQFILRGKEYQLYDLLQIAVSLFFTRFMNLFASMFDMVPKTLLQKSLLLTIAVILSGIGLSMSVSMELAPNPGDGLVQTLSWKTGKSLGFTKNCFDSLNVCITFCIGAVSGHFLLGIGIGTILSMLGVGRVVTLFERLCGKQMLALSGMNKKGEDRYDF